MSLSLCLELQNKCCRKKGKIVENSWKPLHKCRTCGTQFSDLVALVESGKCVHANSLQKAGESLAVFFYIFVFLPGKQRARPRYARGETLICWHSFCFQSRHVCTFQHMFSPFPQKQHIYMHTKKGMTESSAMRSVCMLIRLLWLEKPLQP